MKSRDSFKSFPGTPQQKKSDWKTTKVDFEAVFDCPGSFFRRTEKSGQPKLLGPVSLRFRNQLWLESKICWDAFGQHFVSTESASESFQPVRTRTKFDFVKKSLADFSLPYSFGKTVRVMSCFSFLLFDLRQVSDPEAKVLTAFQKW